jgi:hypothetical protein
LPSSVTKKPLGTRGAITKTTVIKRNNKGKKDFFIEQQDGTFKKLQRGKCKHLIGEWREKSRKHRYLIIYDSNLKTIWVEEPYPKGIQVAPFNNEHSNKPNQEFKPIETSQLKLF